MRLFNLLLFGEGQGNRTDIREIKLPHGTLAWLLRIKIHILFCPSWWKNKTQTHLFPPVICWHSSHGPACVLPGTCESMEEREPSLDTCRHLSPAGRCTHETCKVRWQDKGDPDCQCLFSRNLKRSDWLRKTPWPKKSVTKSYQQLKRLKHWTISFSRTRSNTQIKKIKCTV